MRLVLFLQECQPIHDIVSETGRWRMYRTIIIIVALLVVGFSQAAAAASSASTDNHKTGDGKGLTVDDLGRGLKSAANNIEKEIPKFGSAVGSAIKKITEKGSEKPAK
jgi:peptidoglycan hydrolase CwlO-like protein